MRFSLLGELGPSKADNTQSTTIVASMVASRRKYDSRFRRVGYLYMARVRSSLTAGAHVSYRLYTSISFMYAI